MELKDFGVAIPWVLTLATLGVGVWRFLQQQRQKNKEPFLQRQMEICFQASEAAANLAIETDPAEWEKARRLFWQLYWGTLCIVEDPQVEAMMIAFGDLVPKEPAQGLSLPLTALQEPSYNLAHAMRELILKSWKIKLPPLMGTRT